MSDQTYIGTRTHPKAGVLLKVGISNDPMRRAKELGIEIHQLLPAWCERDIHNYLKNKRVWRLREPDYTFAARYLEPLFPAPTEWFYIDPSLGDWLRAYITYARARETLNRETWAIT